MVTPVGIEAATLGRAERKPCPLVLADELDADWSKTWAAASAGYIERGVGAGNRLFKNASQPQAVTPLLIRPLVGDGIARVSWAA
jgi:hypothetical protein